MRRFLLFAALVLVFGVAHAASEFPPNYSGTADGVQRWAAPDTLKGAGGATKETIAYSRFINGLGVDVARSGEAALTDGRKVSLLYKSLAGGSAVFQVAKGILGGPGGAFLTGLMVLPAFVDWFNSDGGTNIRFGPDGAIQIKDPGSCTVAPCYEYTYLDWSAVDHTRSGSCNKARALADGYFPQYHHNSSYLSGNYCMMTRTLVSNGSAVADYNAGTGSQRTRTPDTTPGWLPASMDDIAPYMQARPVPLDLIPQILAKGGEVPLTPQSVSSVPPAEVPSSVRTTQYPPPPPVYIVEVAPGNPYALPSGTPTQVGTSTGSVSVRPGASTVTGSPSTLPAPQPIAAPTQTTKTATYDQATDKTTTTTTTTTDSLTKTETTTPTTQISNTMSGSTATVGQTTTTVIHNNTTNIDNSVTSGPGLAPEKSITCGLPGTPPCKIDEAGTPTYEKKTMELDKTTLDKDSLAQRTTISGDADKSGMFSGWGAIFALPPLRSCEPVSMPSYMGQQLGSMDVCPGAEWLRGLMGFIWAAAGFMFCFRTVSGVI